MFRNFFTAAACFVIAAVSAVPLSAEQFASVEEMNALRTQVDSLRDQLDQAISQEGGGQGDACGCSAPCQCDCCCVCPGWSFSGEYLHWKLHSDNLHFAWVEEAGPFFGPATLIDVRMQHESGYRLRGAYQTACGWELAGIYTDYQASDETTVVDPLQVGIIRSTRLPVVFQIGGPLQATGAYGFSLETVDAEFAKVVSLDCCTALRLFGGFRYADIQQHLRANYQFSPTAFATFDETMAARVYGVRVGSQGEWCFASGLGLYGRLAGSLLTGTTHRDFAATFFGAVPQNVDSGRHQNQGAIPVLEVAAGVSYHFRTWELAAGYEASSWFGLSRSMRGTDLDIQPPHTNEQFDIVLQGWTFRLGCMF